MHLMFEYHFNEIYLDTNTINGYNETRCKRLRHKIHNGMGIQFLEREFVNSRKNLLKTNVHPLRQLGLYHSLTCTINCSQLEPETKSKTVGLTPNLFIYLLCHS